ncbi:DUF4190 domain-containing protein [Halalkalibacter okhensis]|uniref:DUF4190 domain-containing protein n=1 Tax=Halalkalibacter okhensis TaxID=333138 RepID=A0A0B0IA95_9BACI|nr:DUF4190 domain-containing protein [Halalkalibacter okhensis]KHF38205.1 hypothetical protein LQ50_22610 [Halalkalibacter okhensis]
MNTKAIISLILGSVSLILTSLTLLGLILAIVGFIIGFLSLREIHKTGQKGRGVAIAGLTCNTLAIVIPLMIIIVHLLFLTPADFRLDIS